MKKLVLRKSSANPEIPEGMDPELLKARIRIVGADESHAGKIYYEGSVRTFLIERLPQQRLIDLIAELKDKESVEYRLSEETLRIERVPVEPAL